MKTSVIIVIALLACVVAGQDETFESWKKKHGKKYANNAAEAQARKAYNENAAQVKANNKDVKSTYKQETNANADKSTKDKNNEVNGSLKEKPRKNVKSSSPGSGSSSGTIADKIKNSYAKSVSTKTNKNVKASMAVTLDYSSMIGPVKYEGPCGLAWAFVALLEYQSAKNGSRKVFSEQNLIDCTNNPVCTKGIVEIVDGFLYAMQSGIAESSSYPFVGKKMVCQKKSTYFLNNFVVVLVAGDEEFMKYILNKHGPVGTSLGISNTGFLLYKSGVFYDAKCVNAIHLFATLVGYGTDPVQGDYWIVRTSLGTNFGENGNIRIARNKNNHCGIASYAVPIVPY